MAEILNRRDDDHLPCAEVNFLRTVIGLRFFSCLEDDWS